MINFKKIAIGFGLVSIITLQGLQASKLKECQSEADKKTGCVEIEEWQERGYGLSYGTIETLYKNGKKESIKDYRNGELRFETLYKYTKEGYTEYYYVYGTLLGVTPYKNGKEDGIKKWYHENGKLESETPYKNGKVEGIKRRYYENGKLRSEESYKNDKEDGIEKEYYENGKIKSETPYKNGKQVGVAKVYYENGNLMGKITFKNSDEKGYEAIMKGYYESGKLKTEMTVKNDCLDGIAKEYYESGKLKMEGSYKDCGRDGVMKIYYESGNVKNELTASEDGQYDDKFYTEDGNLLGVVRYNGKAIESVKCAKKKLSDKEAKEIREKFIQLKLRQQDDEHEFIAKHCK